MFIVIILSYEYAGVIKLLEKEKKGLMVKPFIIVNYADMKNHEKILLFFHDLI